MKRFVVKKNTLPYVHQWAVIDTTTGDKVGEYKQKLVAESACLMYEKYGLSDKNDLPSKTENAFHAAKKRMEHPNGNQPPKPPKHSNKRKIELD